MERDFDGNKSCVWNIKKDGDSLFDIRRIVSADIDMVDIFTLIMLLCDLISYMDQESKKIVLDNMK